MKSNLRHRVHPGGSRPLHYLLRAEYLVHDIKKILRRVGEALRRGLNVAVVQRPFSTGVNPVADENLVALKLFFTTPDGSRR